MSIEFGRYFLHWKLAALGLRAGVFVVVMAIADRQIGSNQLMSFVSVVTLAGILLGFGAADSLTVATDTQVRQAMRVSGGLSLLVIFALPLTAMESRGLNLATAAIAFGTAFWNQGLLRRWNPLAYERIVTVHMLVFWIIFLGLLQFERPDFPVLTITYALSNGVLALLARLVARAEAPQGSVPSALLSVSAGKVIWDLSYSALTRLPFVIPSLASRLHPVFSYAYFLFEMTSALLSHRQSRYLHSTVPLRSEWRSTARLLLFINTVAVVALILLFGSVSAPIDPYFDLIAPDVRGANRAIDLPTGALLVLFLSGMTWMQALAYGRYALKLEGHGRPMLVAAIATVAMYAILFAAASLEVDVLVLPFVLLLVAAQVTHQSFSSEPRQAI